MQDPKMSAGEEKEWWAEPAHFSRPLVFYVEADQEELVFGRRPLLVTPQVSHCTSLHLTIRPRPPLSRSLRAPLVLLTDMVSSPSSVHRSRRLLPAPH